MQGARAASGQGRQRQAAIGGKARAAGRGPGASEGLDARIVAAASPHHPRLDAGKRRDQPLGPRALERGPAPGGIERAAGKVEEAALLHPVGEKDEMGADARRREGAGAGVAQRAPGKAPLLDQLADAVIEPVDPGADGCWARGRLRASGPPDAALAPGLVARPRLTSACRVRTGPM